MKLHLILATFAACAACQAGGVTAARPQPKPVQGVKPSSSGRKHLSDAERAELRRQLEEFNRRYRK